MGYCRHCKRTYFGTSYIYVAWFLILGTGDLIQTQLDKNTIRRSLIAQRNAIPAVEKASKSFRICAQLQALFDHHLASLPSSLPVVVGVYAALMNEVQLNEFIHYVYRHHATVVFPAMLPEPSQGQTMAMRVVSYDDYRMHTVPFIEHILQPYPLPSAPTQPIATSLTPTFPVSEPLASKLLVPAPPAPDPFVIIEPTAITFMVVPMVGFTDTGLRMGYGGGNYDRYLPQLHPSCHVVGVAFNEQYRHQLPHDSHDLSIQTIIHA